MGEGTDSKISRRDFTRRAVAAAAVSGPALSASVMLSAQSAALSSSGQAEVDAAVTVIMQKYGNRLTDPQKLDIRRVITDNHKGLEAMRSFPLTNADQPATVLKIYPDEAASAAVQYSKTESK